VERLADSYEWGSAIRRLIELAGWTIHEPVPAFAGGQLFLATNRIQGRDVEVRVIGDTWADVSVELLKQTQARFPPSPAPIHHEPIARAAAVRSDEGPAEDVQLQLHEPT
jgi:hypothetical protein